MATLTKPRITTNERQLKELVEGIKEKYPEQVQQSERPHCDYDKDFDPYQDIYPSEAVLDRGLLLLSGVLLAAIGLGIYLMAR